MYAELARPRHPDPMDVAKELKIEEQEARERAEAEQARFDSLSPEEQWRETMERDAARLFDNCREARADIRTNVRILRGPCDSFMRGHMHDQTVRMISRVYGRPCSQ